MSWLSDVWTSFLHGDRVRTTEKVRIPDDHVIGELSGQVLVSEQDYFTVQVNEFLLDHTRKLWEQYSPSVWASTQFAYAGETKTVPFVIGPALLGQPAESIPQSQLYRDTRIVGPVPYRGGAITLSIVVSRVGVRSAAAELLSVVESTAAAASVTAALSPYLGIAKAVSDGISSLLRLGTQPLVGVRDVVDPGVEGAAETRTGWYVILDETPADPLWVIDRSLRVGRDPASAIPLRGTTYVLYSLTALGGEVGRNDVAQLPDLKEQRLLAERLSNQADGLSWQAAKAVLGDLGLRLRNHPDLTKTQARLVLAEWVTELEALHKESKALASRGPGDETKPEELTAAAELVNQVMGSR